MSAREDAVRTALNAHDAARDLERDEGFPGMFESPERGFIAALEAQDPPFTVVAVAVVPTTADANRNDVAVPTGPGREWKR